MSRWSRFGPSWSVAGGVIALLVGALAVVATRLFPGIGPFGGSPVLLLIGIGWATVLGAYIGGRVVRGGWGNAVLVAFVLGVTSAAATAATVLPVPPFILLAIAASPAAWALTLPAAAAWALLLRRAPTRRFLDSPLGAIVAVIAAIGLLMWRFDTPLVSGAIDRELCASYPGEEIQRLAWSRDGRWLAFSSDRDFTVGTIRILDTTTGTIEAVDSGPEVAGTLGLSVDAAGVVSYEFGGFQTSSANESSFALRAASVGHAPQTIGRLPTGLYVIGVPDGHGGILEAGAGNGPRPVLLTVRAGGVLVTELQPEELGRYPEIGIELAGIDGSFSVELPSGTRTFSFDEDLQQPLTITTDRRYFVFVDSGPMTGEGDYRPHLVAQSVETGKRIVIRDGWAWEARIAGRWLAYLRSPGAENAVCVTRLDAALGL